MARTLWLVALLSASLAPRSAWALDDTTPRVRFGASVGVLGTLPFGDDVAQEGYVDEFDPALWVHVDVLNIDIGPYVQLGAFFRLAVAGGYSGQALTDSLQPRLGESNRLATSPKPKMAQVGLAGRFYPFGEGRVRPFLSLGVAYSTAGANLGTCAEDSVGQGMDAAMGQGMLDAAEAERAAQTYGSSDCPRGGVRAASRRHKGLGLNFGLGVRFDPTVSAFRETWLLPITLEIGYVKNVWLGMQRDPEILWEDHPLDSRLQGDPQAVASNGMQVDFLGLLVTVGFLR